MQFFHVLHQRAEALLGERIFHLLRYLIAGGSAAATNVGALILLVRLGGFHYLQASVIAYLAGVVVSFTLHKFWTFQDKPTHDLHAQFARYVVVLAGNLALNTGMMYLLVSQLGLWYVMAQILTTATVAVTGYIGYKYFVFTKRTV